MFKMTKKQIWDKAKKTINICDCCKTKKTKCISIYVGMIHTEDGWDNYDSYLTMCEKCFWKEESDD